MWQQSSLKNPQAHRRLIWALNKTSSCLCLFFFKSVIPISETEYSWLFSDQHIIKFLPCSFLRKLRKNISQNVLLKSTIEKNKMYMGKSHLNRNSVSTEIRYRAQLVTCIRVTSPSYCPFFLFFHACSSAIHLCPCVFPSKQHTPHYFVISVGSSTQSGTSGFIT